MLEQLSFGSGHNPYGVPSQPQIHKTQVSGTAGALIVGALKDWVSYYKFQGKYIDLWLSSGWIDKTFTLSGDAEVIQTILKALEE